MPRNNYPASFEGWTYVEVSVEEAEELVRNLLAAGAGFGVTSEPGRSTRRIYWFSPVADAIMEAGLRPH